MTTRTRAPETWTWPTRQDPCLHWLERISAEVLAPDFLPIRSHLENVLRILEEFGVERPTIAIHDGRTGDIAIEAATGLDDSEAQRGRYREGEGITGRVFRTRKTAIVPSIAAEPAFLDRTRSRAAIDTRRLGFVCVPILSRTEVYGTLSVDVPDGAVEDFDELARFLGVVAVLLSGPVRLYRDHREEIEGLKRSDAEAREADPGTWRPESMIGNSPAMRDVFRLVRQVAPSDATVLLRGESGTGKELIARAIHESSPRRKGPLVSINCAALPEQLVASELFGHVRGAYTGADSARKGRFELANGGTIFLDEIGEISPTIQVKLLRALQQGEVDRLGDEKSTRVDVRVVAATNAHLEDSIQKGTFRADLYYRLAVFPIFLPPLRDRTGDITLLADHFLEFHAQQHQRNVRRISTPAIELLTSYHWPGNVRELENVMARAVLLSDDGVIRSHHLPPTLQTGKSSGTSKDGSLEERMLAYEREILLEALKDSGNNMAAAARLLGTTPRIVAYRLKRQGLEKS
jgi:Nif-specific regulatory protein